MNKKYLSCMSAICIYIAIQAASADTAVHANNIHAHSDIISTAENFIAAATSERDDAINIKIKSLDKRLQLHACTTPLQAFWPPGASHIGHTTVGIKCSDHKPWKIYVSAQIKLFEEVWVSNTAIARGSLISQANTSLEKREISFIHTEYFNKQHSPIGLLAKRPIRKGDIIQTLALEKPMAIQRGDRVIVIARINGLEIRTAATALSSAAEGDRIRVRNLSSKKELEGILSKDNVVHVNI